MSELNPQPIHLENAEKEVVSVKAQKEIEKARTAIRELAKLVVALDERDAVLNNHTIRAIIKALEDKRKSLYLADKLKRLSILEWK